MRIPRPTQNEHELKDYYKNMHSRLFQLLLVMFCGSFCVAPAASALQYSAEKPLGAAAQKTPDYLKNAGIDQRLNSALPLGDHFRDETGQDVSLGKYFGSRPVVMASGVLQVRNAVSPGAAWAGGCAAADGFPCRESV